MPQFAANNLPEPPVSGRAVTPLVAVGRKKVQIFLKQLLEKMLFRHGNTRAERLGNQSRRSMRLILE